MCQSAFQLCSWLQSKENRYPLTSEKEIKKKRKERDKEDRKVERAS